jgi:hypothetical protein
MARFSRIEKEGSLRRLIRRAYGTGKLDEVGRKLARDVHVRSRAAGPPFEPREFARWLGVAVVHDDIVAEGMFIEGNVQRERGGMSSASTLDHYQSKSPTIVLKSGSGLPTRSARMRERFTIAHELGHFSIRNALADAPHDGLFSGRDPEEEMLCNSFAEELLVPRQGLSRDLCGLELSATAMLELRDKYQVSLTCMLCSISRLFRGAVAAVIWKQEGHWLTVHWSTPKSYRDLLLCDTGSTSVELAMRSSTEQIAVDQFLLNGARLKWKASSCKLPESPHVLSVLKRGNDSLKRCVDNRPPVAAQTRTPIQASFSFSGVLAI